MPFVERLYQWCERRNSGDYTYEITGAKWGRYKKHIPIDWGNGANSPEGPMLAPVAEQAWFGVNGAPEIASRVGAKNVATSRDTTHCRLGGSSS